MPNTIYQKSSGFLPKWAEIKVLGDTGGSWKEIGRAIINLSDFIESPAKERVFPLQKCQERDASLCLSVSTDASRPEESKRKEQSTDDLIKQLNDSKNKLSALRGEFEEVCTQKESLRAELASAQAELASLKAPSGEQRDPVSLAKEK